MAEIPWKNLLIEGDNLGAADTLRQRFQGEVDLIYLDPPFATEADFTLRAAPGQKGPVAYSDRWADRDSYLAFLRARLALCHELLGTCHAQTGLHVHRPLLRADQLCGKPQLGVGQRAGVDQRTLQRSRIDQQSRQRRSCQHAP